MAGGSGVLTVLVGLAFHKGLKRYTNPHQWLYMAVRSETTFD